MRARGESCSCLCGVFSDAGALGVVPRAERSGRCQRWCSPDGARSGHLGVAGVPRGPSRFAGTLTAECCLEAGLACFRPSREELFGEWLVQLPSSARHTGPKKQALITRLLQLCPPHRAAPVSRDEETAATSLAAKLPLGVPWITPDDVAPAVVYLASDAARMVSGTALSITGGDSARVTA
ncbi:SDR family oxidoreductase [Streptomyces bauhiniae]|uniref:SDR family oxidoreductase n=1 Tax=Streptomyces bauhiniae TaxID=2340725 RepID=A0A7K3QTN2_9ACTN|nr:SDR family oxidoreductase [Streptomyces bauhiniae]NEB93190.1 SDR family oxidoreductase [Streptomyces bauhiniae]